MAYNKEKLYKQALELAKENKCFFIEHLISFMPCQKSTFYEMFPNSSEESDAIKEIINKNKTEVKISMYNKWFKSDNATLQVALMRLISTPEEHKKLNQSYLDHTNDGQKFNIKGITFNE